MPENDRDKLLKPRGWRHWWQHAFAVEKYDESSLSEDEKNTLLNLAKRIHDRGMAAPAIVWAESHRYLNFIGSQALVMFQPIFDMTNPFLNALLGRFGMYIPPEEYPKLYSALEKRYSIEYFIQQLEALSAKDYNKGSIQSDSVPGSPAATEQTQPDNNHDKDED